MSGEQEKLILNSQPENEQSGAVDSAQGRTPQIMRNPLPTPMNPNPVQTPAVLVTVKSSEDRDVAVGNQQLSPKKKL